MYIPRCLRQYNLLFCLLERILWLILWRCHTVEQDTCMMLNDLHIFYISGNRDSIAFLLDCGLVAVSLSSKPLCNRCATEEAIPSRCVNNTNPIFNSAKDVQIHSHNKQHTKAGSLVKYSKYDYSWKVELPKVQQVLKSIFNRDG